ncbi:hypothetical protein LC574_11275 [Nostoc sp. CHAB 5715]|nr:hypothetical protein [Nostoc sp. CHAB 5715]
MRYQQGYWDIEKVLQGIDSRLKNPTQWPVVDARSVNYPKRVDAVNKQSERHRFTTTG